MIDGEGIMDMLDRNFTYLRHQNRGLMSELKLLKTKQDSIRVRIVSREPSIKEYHNIQSISSKGLKSLNSEVKSFRTFQSFYFGKPTEVADINPDYILQERIFHHRQHSNPARSKDQNFFDALVDSQKDIGTRFPP
jgi:hypothetical protein